MMVIAREKLRGRRLRRCRIEELATGENDVLVARARRTITTSNGLAVRVVATADRMPVIGMRVPGEAPATVDMAVVVMPPEECSGEDRAPRPDPAPELVTVAFERIEPAEHLAILRVSSDALRHARDVSLPDQSHSARGCTAG